MTNNVHPVLDTTKVKMYIDPTPAASQDREEAMTIAGTVPQHDTDTRPAPHEQPCAYDDGWAPCLNLADGPDGYCRWCRTQSRIDPHHPVWSGYGPFTTGPTR